MCVSILLSVLTGGYEQMTLDDIVKNATSIIVYNDGIKTEYTSNSANFTNVVDAFVEIVKSGHEMPAFGVSLHDSTIDSIQTGLWVEFVFEKTKVYNEMPFETLLINVEKDWSGFNIIRKHDSKYEGRCFYINLENADMSKLYELLTR